MSYSVKKAQYLKECKKKNEPKPNTSRAWTCPLNSLRSVSKHRNRGENWASKKKKGGKETDSEVRTNQTDEVMHKNLYGKNSGWSCSLHTRLTCFQIITKKKKAVFTLRHTKTRWEVWPHSAAPLKSYFQFSKCVIGLGRGTGLSHGAAGSLSRTLPSLLQRWWTSLALAGLWP